MVLVARAGLSEAKEAQNSGEWRVVSGEGGQGWTERSEGSPGVSEWCPPTPATHQSIANALRVTKSIAAESACLGNESAFPPMYSDPFEIAEDPGISTESCPSSGRQHCQSEPNQNDRVFLHNRFDRQEQPTISAAVAVLFRHRICSCGSPGVSPMILPDRFRGLLGHSCAIVQSPPVAVFIIRERLYAI